MPATQRLPTLFIAAAVSNVHVIVTRKPSLHSPQLSTNMWRCVDDNGQLERNLCRRVHESI